MEGWAERKHVAESHDKTMNRNFNLHIILEVPKGKGTFLGKGVLFYYRPDRIRSEDTALYNDSKLNSNELP